MRVIVIRQPLDPQGLARDLFGLAADASAMFERVKALNPHVDFDRIPAGTVLLVPDAPESRAGGEAVRSPGSDGFEAVAQDALAGLKAASERAASAGEASAADRAAFTAVLKTAAVKRLIESDPLLKAQVEQATRTFDADRGAVQEAARQIELVAKTASEELAALKKLLD